MDLDLERQAGCYWRSAARVSGIAWHPGVPGISDLESLASEDTPRYGEEFLGTMYERAVVSDMSEFLRVGYNANGPNLPGLHFNRQHRMGT